jgi:hypothetical protein
MHPTDAGSLIALHRASRCRRPIPLWISCRAAT